MTLRFLVLASALAIGTMARAGDAELRQWQGSLDLRRAVTIKSEKVAVDAAELRLAGIERDAFTPPRRTKSSNPVYPDSAARAGAQGTVLLECLITELGAVDACRVSQSVFPAIDRAAVDAIRHWRYDPARVNDEPRRIVVRFMMIFRLQ